MLLRFLVSMFSVGLMSLGAGVASGQHYPTKPIRMVTSAPGGGADYVARVIAGELTAALGQQVVVDNRGGSTIIPTEIVVKAPPDGYTLQLSAGSLWLMPLLQDNVPYDPLRDLSPISLTTSSPSMLVVHPSMPVKSVKELIALAKARPGVLNYAAGVIGSSTHLSSALFEVMAGINMVRVPYRGANPALIALIGGEVDLMFITASSGMPHVKSGKLRALAVGSARPSALAPGLPTMAASGLPGYEYGTTHGVFAPAKTPEAIITRLNQQIVRFLNRADVKAMLFKRGLEVVASSPEELTATMKSEIARMGKVIEVAGIRLR